MMDRGALLAVPPPRRCDDSAPFDAALTDPDEPPCILSHHQFRAPVGVLPPGFFKLMFGHESDSIARKGGNSAPPAGFAFHQ